MNVEFQSSANERTPQQGDMPPSQAIEPNDPPQYDPKRHAHKSLAYGDPQETIEVPMVTRTGGMVKDSLHWMNPFSRKFGDIKTSITTRKMRRDFYLKHYAKDVEGKYIGTAAPAPDAALVYIPSMSSPEDLQNQANEVALGKQRLRGNGIGKFGQPQEDNNSSNTRT